MKSAFRQEKAADLISSEAARRRFHPNFPGFHRAKHDFISISPQSQNCCAWLEKEHMERFLLPSLESVIDAKIKDSEGRIRNVEFKMATQIAMLTELLAEYFFSPSI